MKIHQRAPKNSGGIHEKTSLLELRAQNDDDLVYLAWLGRAERSGQTREIYREEIARQPGVLDGLTEETLRDAYEVYRSGCEGRLVSLDLGRIEDLEERGLVRDVKLLPGRGRYAGRFEFTSTDRLEIVVRAMQIKGLGI